jgi:ABC-type branched-subunit amino acid transport system permease subunit
MGQYLVSVATQAAILAILVMGVNVRWGYAGELDLGFYIYPAIGAYVYGVVVLPKANALANVTYVLGLNQSFIVGVLAAAVVGGLLSVAIGYVALRRLRASYFGIVTVSFTIIAYTFISQYKPLFNGYNGLYGLPQPFGGVWALSPSAFATFFLILCLVFMVAVYLVLELIRRSPFGLAVRAVREDEVASLAYGRNPFVLRLKAYVIGGVVGAIGGALLINYVTAFSPGAWSALETFLLYGALLVGGTGNNLGATVGATLVLVAFVQGVAHLGQIGSGADSGPAIEDMVIGLLIILTLWFRPSGLFPELQSRQGQVRTRGQWTARLGLSTPAMNAKAAPESVPGRAAAVTPPDGPVGTER